MTLVLVRARLGSLPEEGLSIPIEPPSEDQETLWIVEEEAAEGLPRAGPLDLPARWDLPEGHPLRGKALLPVVPAGYPDCTVDDNGRLVPVDSQTGDPLPEGTL